jgi:tetratricopeptide (TPR) repeat protein
MNTLVERTKRLVPIPQKILNCIGTIKSLNKQIKEEKQSNNERRIHGLSTRLKENLETLGINLIFSSEYETAKKQFQILQKQLEEEDEELLKGFCITNIGIIYRLQGKEEKAKDCFIDAKEIFEKANNSEGIASIHLEQGMIALESNDLEFATMKGKKAQKYYRKSHYKQGEGLAFVLLAQIAKKKKDETNALNYYYEALELLEEEGHPIYSANIYSELASIYYEKGRFFKTLEFLNKALELRFIMEDIIGQRLDYRLVKKITKELGLKLQHTWPSEREIEL